MTTTKAVAELDRVVIRFAGDSGDGMQLTGDRFTSATAAYGNDLATLPDYPAEIRAPAGSIAGVSGFQIHFSSDDVTMPGDAPDVLVAMNPAALRSNVRDLPPGGTLIVNEDAFTDRNMEKVGYTTNPLDDGSLEAYTVYRIPLTSMTVKSVEGLDISKKEAERTKNMFALGLMSWMYGRPTEATETWIAQKFASKPAIKEANLKAFRAGWNFGETTELIAGSYVVRPQQTTPGTYRNISGNTALAYGLVAASRLSGLPLFLGSYPITPASDILHELSKHKNFGVRTFQAEDEIAAAASALGAAFGGSLAVTTTAGPGVALKAETISLAVSVELPLVIVNIQRGGPSTGLPTKTEQSDLFQAMYGRHGESPMPIVAAYSASDCFAAAIEACRIATKYRTPVFLLSDGFLANGAEPWLLPKEEDLPDLTVRFTEGPNHGDEFWPFLRDPETLARPWAVPGTPGLMHRIGGIEKADGTGHISYDPANHQLMSELRRDKVAGIAKDIPPLDVDDPSGNARILVLGWGSTWGAIRAACRRVRSQGVDVAHAHLRHLNPFPANTGDVLRSYDRVLIPEMNLGQLWTMVRAQYLVDAEGLNKIMGRPFTATEIAEKIQEMST